MIPILEQIIADYYDRALPKLTRRQTLLPKLSGKVSVIMGMRRSGKTWFMYQEITDLIASGVSPNAILYLNFEDERLLPLQTSDLQEITVAYYRRFPDQQRNQTYF